MFWGVKMDLIELEQLINDAGVGVLSFEDLQMFTLINVDSDSGAAVLDRWAEENGFRLFVDRANEMIRVKKTSRA